MGLISRISRSTDLVKGMADRLGTDIADFVAHNPEQRAAEFRAMAFFCTGCSDQESCARMQADHAHLDAAPDYCLNKHRLESLRPV